MKITKSQYYQASPWFAVIVLVIIIDQIIKYLILTHINENQSIKIFSFFNLILSFNQGSAFGFLNHAGGWQVLFFSLISVIVIVVMLVWLLRLQHPSKWTACALSLVIGGATGNLIDRVRFYQVTDFLDFHLGNWHYATFNLADSAIVVGVIMLLLQTCTKKKV